MLGRFDEYCTIDNAPNTKRQFPGQPSEQLAQTPGGPRLLLSFVDDDYIYLIQPDRIELKKRYKAQEMPISEQLVQKFLERFSAFIEKGEHLAVRSVEALPDEKSQKLNKMAGQLLGAVEKGSWNNLSMTLNNCLLIEGLGIRVNKNIQISNGLLQATTPDAHTTILPSVIISTDTNTLPEDKGKIAGQKREDIFACLIKEDRDSFSRVSALFEKENEN